MHDIMGIINLSEKEDRIKEITHNRPIAAIPIAGRYRVVDFILSNMVNAGIENISIFTQGKSRSLVEHLGSGKEWDLNRKIDGLFILNPIIDLDDRFFPLGDIKNFKDHIDYIQTSKQNYVLLSRSYMICNINYEDVFKYHKESNSDITIVYKHISDNDLRFLNCDILNLNENGKVMSIGKNLGNMKSCNVSMEMYIMKKDLLIKLIENCISKGDCFSLKHAIHNDISKLNVNSYCFDGYLSSINSIENYYKSNMDLLDIDISQELFYKHGYIYTKIKDEAPTKYGENSDVINSIIANGCVIEGIVKNSIIGRGVKIKKEAVIENSILMQGSIIEKNANLKNVVLDKNVHIGENKFLCGDMQKPIVIEKNLTL